MLVVYGVFLPRLPGPGPATDPTVSIATALTVLAALRPRVAVARRVFRLFRFLENFQGAHALALSLAGGGAPAGAWLALAARSCNGAYLLLESATLADALGVPGLAPWGPAAAEALGREAQRFWFLALVAGAAGGAAALVRTRALAAVPDSGEGYGLGADGVAGVGEKERRAREEKRRATQRRERARSRAVARRLVADLLDLAVPGSVIGWVNLDRGVVSIMMLGSTVLTAAEVWERCGEEVRRGS